MKTKGRRIAIGSGILALVVLSLAIWLGWPHILFWYRFASLGLNAQGYTEYRHRQTGIVMVRLPGGKFWMGAQSKDPSGLNYDPDAEPDEAPVHEVTLSPFLIGKYEVTQAQWKAVMGSNPSRDKGNDERPVENVSWENIQGFEAKTGLCLPSEAQWEYACRAGTTTPFAGNLDDIAWYCMNSGDIHPFGKKAPNGFGLHDMHGNVWEWCEDILDDSFNKEPEGKETDAFSYTYPLSMTRILRGGSWGDNFWYCRSSNRGWADRCLESPNFGFRVVYPLQ